MPKPGPRTIYKYSEEFKASAVRLSQLPGVAVQDEKGLWTSHTAGGVLGNRFSSEVKLMNKTLVFLASILLSSLGFANPVWIDVRTPEEYAQNHINGDVRISHEQIVPEVEKLFPDKNAEIHLYCRSGRRAGIAVTKLKEAGYKNVSNAGGIDDARKQRAVSDESCSPRC